METLKSFAVLVLVLAFAYEVERCNCDIQHAKTGDLTVVEGGSENLPGRESLRQRPLSKWQVMIWNNYKNPPVEAHCKSKDNDLGVHVIQSGTQYSWEFKENFWGTTLYWCEFKSKLGHASFEVFWPEKGNWLSDRCSDGTCFWIASKKGFSLFTTDRKLVFLHPWEPATS